MRWPIPDGLCSRLPASWSPCSSPSRSPAPAPARWASSLGVAVLLDAGLVRLMLLPVLMRLAGPGLWWIPAGWTGACLGQFRSLIRAGAQLATGRRVPK